MKNNKHININEEDLQLWRNEVQDVERLRDNANQKSRDNATKKNRDNAIKKTSDGVLVKQGIAEKRSLAIQVDMGLYVQFSPDTAPNMNEDVDRDIDLRQNAINEYNINQDVTNKNLIRNNITKQILITQQPVRYPIYDRETPTIRLNKIDVSLMRQLRLERMIITHKIDLHDMSLAVAYEALYGFLRGAWHDGAKIALVITGKGSRQNSRQQLGMGELRRNLPRWCIEPSFQPMVVALQQSLAHHGGEGAFYVQIRRQGI